MSESGEKGTPAYNAIYLWPGKAPKSLAQITFLDEKVRSTSQNGLK